MALKANRHYWRYSLQHLEPIGESYYRHDNVIIQSESYLSTVSQLRELITTYCTLRKLGTNSQVIQHVLQAIDAILRSAENIQYTEFVAYWKCLDLTFSVYQTMEEINRLQALEGILNEYCQHRRELYDQMGYTHVVQQALHDSTKSRSQGEAGTQKLLEIVQQVMTQTQAQGKEVDTADAFNTATVCWLMPKRDSFEQLMQSLGASYRFGETHQGKIPDLAIKAGKIVFVVEAKHVKEPGGAQDKQISELIDFIRQGEPKNSPVRYVAFLDGIYFNIIANARQGKPYRQRTAIEDVLQSCPRNYFVNTEGFRHLLKDAFWLAQRPSRR